MIETRTFGLLCFLPLALPLVACTSPLQTLTLDFDTTPAARVSLDESSLIDIHFTSPGGLVELKVDCNPSDDTDTVGFSFLLSGPFTTPTQRAGYVLSREVVPAGDARFQLLGYDGPATCTLSLTPVPTACGTVEEFRSVNVDHNHVTPGDEPRPDWEAFPVSGNHYPVWAAWDMAYDIPIRTGYLIHDLEHGGIVFSYRCGTAQDSPACTQASTDLMKTRADFAQTRTLLTPDPTQPALYAARAWRWGYTSSCFDEPALTDFATRRFRKGREDIDSDAAPFDPTH